MQAWKYLNLEDFEKVQFPVELCIDQNQREPKIFDAKETFVCIIGNSRFEDYFRGAILKPYIYKGDATEGTLYGWIDLDGNIVDHFEKCIHGDDEVVVAWKAI